MARFQSSTFGKISGKHGNAVAAVRKDGLNILKVYRVASNPNTVGQKNQRGKFGFAVKQLNCMRKLFTVTFGGQYGTNRAVALAMKTCISGESPDFSIDYSLLQLAVGNLPLAENIKFRSQPDNKFRIEWNTQTIPNQNQNDSLSVVVFFETWKQMIVLQDVSTRSNGTYTFELTENQLNTGIHCWIFFKSTDKKRFSNSQYLKE
jgi:hypothetical protein